MAPDAVTLLREDFDSYRTRGIEGLLEYTKPDIQWHTGGTFVDEGTCRGHDEVRRYIGVLREARRVTGGCTASAVEHSLAPHG